MTAQVPVLLVIVYVAPEFPQEPALVNKTGEAEVAVAATVKLLLKAALAGALAVNAIVCEITDAFTVCVTGGAVE